MKNAILYYYGLRFEDIHQTKKKHIFTFNGSKYILTPLNEINIDIIYELSIFLIQKNIPIHQIVLNKDRLPVTNINNDDYVLLKVLKDNINIISANDLYCFSNIRYEYQKGYYINKSWQAKIDYIEYQQSSLSTKYKLIDNSIQYFIGLGETAISLMQYLDNEQIEISIVHNRVKSNTTIFDLYNPLNLVLDNKVRDFGELFKSRFFNGDNVKIDIESFLNKILPLEQTVFLARMLFPTYYFDLYEKIIMDNWDEQLLNKILLKTEEYEQLLIYIYSLINKSILIPDIEWLKKDVILH